MTDYQKILNKTKKWIIQGGVITPHLDFLAAESLTKGLEEFVPGYGMEFILTFFQDQGRKSNWVEDEDFVNLMGEKTEKNPTTANKVIKKWVQKKNEYYKFLFKLKTKGIKELLSEYKQFRKFYYREYSLGLFTECFTPWSDNIVARVLDNLPPNARDDIQTMILPIDKSFMADEGESSLTIGYKLMSIAKKEKKKVSELSFQLIKKKYPKCFEELCLHQRKFFWVQNNYKHTEPVPLEIFFNSIKNSINSKPKMDIKNKIKFFRNYKMLLEQKRKKIIKRWSIKYNDIEKLYLVSKLAWLHDRKKKANLIGNFWINEFLKKGSKILKVRLIDLQFMLPDEFEYSLQRKKIPSDIKRKVEKRKKGCLLINHISGRYWILTGKEFGKYKKEILEAKFNQDIKEFRGARASSGIIQGKVKVVLNPKDSIINEGEILVTHQTRPDFVPLMKLAKGIVTDEGGIISHAAIISRELGIPCVVGTRIATKVLKDGMLIEVNANHGVVRILK